MGYMSIDNYNDPFSNTYSSDGYSSYTYTYASSTNVGVLVPVLIGLGALLVLVLCVTMCCACCACCRIKSRGRVLLPPPAEDAAPPQPSYPGHVITYPVAPPATTTQFFGPGAGYPPPYPMAAPYSGGAAHATHLAAVPGVLSVNDTETYKLLE